MNNDQAEQLADTVMECLTADVMHYVFTRGWPLEVALKECMERVTNVCANAVNNVGMGVLAEFAAAKAEGRAVDLTALWQ